MSDERKSDGKGSFISEARREQMMEAAIATLDEIGFAAASLSQIAKRAGISTALISYHFDDKNDLMNHLLMRLVGQSTEYIVEQVRKAATPAERLRAFIASSLAYQEAHPSRYTALLEIIFHARTPENVPYYKLNDPDDEEPIMMELTRLLREGQQEGAFGVFRVEVMATAIQGAIGEYLLNPAIAKSTGLEAYTNELVRIFEKAVR
ncbi:TetR/AcrR family transcriptional regulator [Paenibacillus sp. LHD-117]|uniref:TetR/AcrR family transcriptional regulator n=1 Tax=Paenibacillus sp. LHD-117 TaxID=3071412 RepID=UPI0027E169BF|nr:TetR/AcrR family transcriptional regulator [Paenibacillus sp. LHD-117]MDQ6418882.1 TetR/AcrR family transcriptional regulator [Paenibacillus sp. LHD-117]